MDAGAANPSIKMSKSEIAKNIRPKIPCMNKRQESVAHVAVSDSSNGSDRPLVSKNVHFATPDGDERPISFMKPCRIKSKNAYSDIRDHPHFHPMVHGEGAIALQNETQDVDGEKEDNDDDGVADKQMIRELKQSMDRNHNDLNDIKRV